MNAWAAAIGGAAVAVWLITAPPWRDGRRGWLRAGAATVLLLGLLDVSCRFPGRAPAPLLLVLIDRSGSMEVAGPTGATRREAGRAWLEGPDFRGWTEGWRVRIDSFGGSDSDPGRALERALGDAPDAILLVSDGRVSGGRSIESAPVPVYAFVPEPEALPDAAVLDLSLDGGEGGRGDLAVVEVAAVGGRPIPAGLVELEIAGRVSGSRDLPPFEPGERRLVRFPIPADGRGYTRVTARVAVAGDSVPGNDERSLIREPPGPSRALAVALAPAWDFAPWRRALGRSHPGGVDAFWSFPGGGLRPVDGGRTVDWADLSPERYAAVHLFGPPAALGAGGRRWVERLAGAGGRGILWAPGGGAGELAGAGVQTEGSRPDAVPALSEEGRAWVRRIAGVSSGGPDGGPGWPPLEDLPSRAPATPGATVLLVAGGSPVAWVAEEGTTRRAVILGTGYYRWALEGGAEGEAGVEFWRTWSDALIRWLASASPSFRPLVRLPAGRAIPSAQPMRLPVVEDPVAVRWRLERDGEEVARGELGAGDPARAIALDPLPPGEYSLQISGSEESAREQPFVVERWSPELAWTAADTATLTAAARRSGGDRIRPGVSPPALEPASPPAASKGRRLDVGTWPWTWVLAALLLLADWGLARPGSR